MKYILGHHYATGEGTTISMMIAPETDGPEYIKRQCEDCFTSYYADSCYEVNKEEFLIYHDYIPSAVLNYLNGQQQWPPTFFWVSQIHKNY